MVATKQPNQGFQSDLSIYPKHPNLWDLTRLYHGHAGTNHSPEENFRDYHGVEHHSDTDGQC